MYIFYKDMLIHYISNTAKKKKKVKDYSKAKVQPTWLNHLSDMKTITKFVTVLAFLNVDQEQSLTSGTGLPDTN